MPAIEATGAYCGVETFKAATRAGSDLPDTSRDAIILEHLLAASRSVEQQTIRRYFPVTAMQPSRWPPLHVAASWEVWTEDDLLSVSLIQVAAAGQNAVPVTLTHYLLEPAQFGPPYNRVEVDLSYSDVFQSGPTPQRSVQITGQWGYCNTTRSAGTLNGTTAAAHSNGAAIRKYQAPADIRRLVRGDAISSFQMDLAAWGRTVGSGETAAEWQGKALAGLRQSVIQQYRRVRSAAI